MFNFRERHRRHKIVHTHGLILPNRTKSWLAKYNKATGLKKCHENNLNSGRFVALMQLTTGLAFDRIVEGLQYEYDLRKYLNKLVFQVVLQFSKHVQFKSLFQCKKKLLHLYHRLYELRTKGITTCYGGKYFQNAKINRLVRANNLKPLLWEWKHIQNEKDSLTGTEQIMKHCMDLNQLPKKRRSTPLNIIGLNSVYFKYSNMSYSLLFYIPQVYQTTTN